jgi:hypothetical protein
MANVPVNPTALYTSTTATGSFAGFTVVSGSSAVITGLKDYQGQVLATAAAPMVIPAGHTIPVYVTSASLSTGAILLYP